MRNSGLETVFSLEQLRVILPGIVILLRRWGRRYGKAEGYFVNNWRLVDSQRRAFGFVVRV